MNLNIMRCGRIWPYPFCCQHDYSCLVLEGRCQPQFLFQTNMDLKWIIAKSFSYQWQQGLFCFLGSFKKVPLRPTVRQECKLDKTAALITTLMTRNYVRLWIFYFFFKKMLRWYMGKYDENKQQPTKCICEMTDLLITHTKNKWAGDQS